MKIRNWFGLIISVLTLAWLVYTYDFNEAIRPLKEARYAYFLGLVLLLPANFLLRAVRWKLLFSFPAPQKLGNVFKAMMVGYLFNNVMPARAGELVRIYLLGKSENLSKSTVLATVVVERTADLLIVMALAAGVVMYYPFPSWLNRSGIVLSIATAVAIFILVALKLFGTAMVKQLVQWVKFLPSAITQRMDSMGGYFISGISALFSPSTALKFSLYSAAIWILEICIVYLVALAFNIPASVGGLLFVMLMIAIGTMVPSSPGYIGTYEFFGLSALAMLNISGGLALSFVVAMHAVTFLGSCAIGLICLAALKTTSSTRLSSELNKPDEPLGKFTKT